MTAPGALPGEPRELLAASRPPEARSRLPVPLTAEPGSFSWLGGPRIRQVKPHGGWDCFTKRCFQTTRLDHVLGCLVPVGGGGWEVGAGAVPYFWAALTSPLEAPSEGQGPPSSLRVRAPRGWGPWESMAPSAPRRTEPWERQAGSQVLLAVTCSLAPMLAVAPHATLCLRAQARNSGSTSTLPPPFIPWELVARPCQFHPLCALPSSPGWPPAGPPMGTFFPLPPPRPTGGDVWRVTPRFGCLRFLVQHI